MTVSGHDCGHDSPDNIVIRWLIEHKSCSDLPKCWAAAPNDIRRRVIEAWGGVPRGWES